MRIDVAFTQHSGKLHSSQQDALWDGRTAIQSSDLPVDSHVVDVGSLLIAVADGVSVSPVPQHASRVVIEALAEIWAAQPNLDGRTVRKVHGMLCDRLARGRTFGASTTLVAAQIAGGRCTVVNVGDSRAYHVTPTADWRRLSRDHTVLEDLIEKGQAVRGTDYARIYDALEHCLIADDDEATFPVHRSEVAFEAGDTLLLCSDGIHDCLGEDQLRGMFDPARPLPDQVRIWREAVLQAGAPDNLSIILARCLSFATHP